MCQFGFTNIIINSHQLNNIYISLKIYIVRLVVEAQLKKSEPYISARLKRCVVLASEFGLNLLNPAPDLGDPGVHPRVVGLSAPDAPGHDADLLPGIALTDHEGSATVTLK